MSGAARMPEYRSSAPVSRSGRRREGGGARSAPTGAAPSAPGSRDRPGPTRVPFLTVLISAFRRHAYLEEAVRSVQSSPVDPGEYEVVLVSDRLEEGLAQRLAGAGVRLFESSASCVGEMLSAGIREARGEVVAFLDDDDVFTREKVGHLIRVFQDPSIVHYHHRFARVDSDRQPLYDPGPPVRNPLVFDLPLTELELSRIRHAWGYYNTSSHAVRRSALLDQLGTLSRVTNHQDFCMVALLSAPGRVVIDRSTVLVEYRTHFSQGNHDLSGPVVPEAHLQFLRGTTRSCLAVAESGPYPAVRRYSRFRAHNYETVLFAISGETVGPPRGVLLRSLRGIAGNLLEGDFRYTAVLSILLALSARRPWAVRTYLWLKRADPSLTRPAPRAVALPAAVRPANSTGPER